jgi:hypothetical protein
MKKAFILMMMGIGLWRPAGADTQPGPITLNLQAGPGETATVCAHADDRAKGFSGLDLDFRLSEGITVADEGVKTFRLGAFPSDTIVAFNTATPGRFHVAIVTYPPQNGPFDIGCFDVTVSSALVGIIRLSSTVNDVNADVIGHPSAALMLPSEGDLNGDQKVNVLDVVKALRRVLGIDSGPLPSALDINRDGKTDVADVQLFLRLIVTK